MNDRAALLRAVLENPADDTVRLVYADWLQENGQEDRAEFIRVQCERERVPGCSSPRCQEIDFAPGEVAYMRLPDCGGCDPCRKAIVLRLRERSLEPECLDAECARFVAWGVRPSWRRGFVESVTCPAADWFAHGDEIRKAHPVTRVTLTTWPDIEELTIGCLSGVRYYYYRVAERDVLMERGDGSRPGMVHVLAVRWPGVAFDRPPGPPQQLLEVTPDGGIILPVYPPPPRRDGHRPRTAPVRCGHCPHLKRNTRSSVPYTPRPPYGPSGSGRTRAARHRADDPEDDRPDAQCPSHASPNRDTRKERTGRSATSPPTAERVVPGELHPPVGIRAGVRRLRCAA